MTLKYKVWDTLHTRGIDIDLDTLRKHFDRAILSDSVIRTIADETVNSYHAAIDTNIRTAANLRYALDNDGKDRTPAKWLVSAEFEISKEHPLNLDAWEEVQRLRHARTVTRPAMRR